MYFLYLPARGALKYCLLILCKESFTNLTSEMNDYNIDRIKVYTGNIKKIFIISNLYKVDALCGHSE